MPLGVDPPSPSLMAQISRHFFTPLFFSCNWILHIWNETQAQESRSPLMVFWVWSLAQTTTQRHQVSWILVPVADRGWQSLLQDNKGGILWATIIFIAKIIIIIIIVIITIIIIIIIILESGYCGAQVCVSQIWPNGQAIRKSSNFLTTLSERRNDLDKSKRDNFI